MRKDEGKFLKERAEDFFTNASDLLKKGRFNLAAFNLEQASQLFLKHTLFCSLGDFPKTHSLKMLFRQLAKVYKEKATSIQNFEKKNIETIANLENAYLTSRYFPVEFTKEELVRMEKFTLRLINFLKKI